MKISSIKVIKDKTMKEALDQGFAVNFFECGENEMQLMLPTLPEILVKAVNYHGWTSIGEPIYS